MKDSTSEIADLIEEEPFHDLADVLKIADDEGFVFESNEYELREALVDLEEIINVLETAVDHELLDDLIQSERHEITDQLKKVRGELNQIREDRNDRVSPFLDQTAQLKKLLYHELQLEYKTDKKIDFTQQIREVKELRKEIKELQSQLINADKKVNSISKFEKQIENISNKADTHLEELQQSKSSTEEKIREIERNIESYKIDLEEILDRSENLFIEIETKHDEVLDKSDNVDELEIRLDDGIQELENITDNIDKQLERSGSLQDDVDDLLSGTIGATLGTNFKERKQELEKSARNWAIATLVSVGILIAAAWLIFQDITGDVNLGVSTLSKIALILPVSVAVVFTARNYSRERKLLEEYAFKTTMSLSLDGFREVLVKQMPEEEDETISDFLTTSMLEIYTNPLHNLSKANAIEDDDNVGSISTMQSAWESLRNR